jgi:hypothetical protein
VMPEKLKAAEKVEDLTPIQRIAKLDIERAEIVATAKADALQKANEAVEELNALGFKYELTERTAAETVTTKKGQPADADCPVCKFKTDPPHDKRSHRLHPGAFSEDDLRERNLVRA